MESIDGTFLVKRILNLRARESDAADRFARAENTAVSKTWQLQFLSYLAMFQQMV